MEASALLIQIFCLELSMIGGKCPLDVAAALIDDSMDEQKLRELCALSSALSIEGDELVLRSADVALLPFKPLFEAAELPLEKGTLPDIVLSFISEDYQTAIAKAHEFLEALYYSDKINEFYFSYMVIGNFICDIKSKNLPKYIYDNMIYHVKAIQLYATMISGKSILYSNVSRKVIDMAIYFGDLRTESFFRIYLYFYDKKFYKKISLKDEVTKIFSFGDDDIITISSTAIAVFYILNCKYLQCFSFYKSVYKKFSSSNLDNEIKCRLQIYTAIAMLYAGRYHIVDDIIKNLLKKRNQINIILKSFINIISMLINKNGHFVQFEKNNLYFSGSIYELFIILNTSFSNINKEDQFKNLIYIIRTNPSNSALFFRYIAEKLFNYLSDRDQWILLQKIMTKYISSSYPLIGVIALRIYGVCVFQVEKNVDKALRIFNSAIRLAEINTLNLEKALIYIEIAKLYYTINNTEMMFYYGNMAKKVYFLFIPHLWKKEFEIYSNLSEDFLKYLQDFTAVTSFFKILRYQQFFNSKLPLPNTLLRTFLYTFNLRVGILVSLRKGRDVIPLAAETLEENVAEDFPSYFMGEIKKRMPQLDLSLQANESDGTPAASPLPLRPLSITCLIPIITEQTTYVLYCYGKVSSTRLPAFSVECMWPIQAFLATSLDTMENNRIQSPQKKLPAKNEHGLEEVFQSKEICKIISQLDEIAVRKSTVLLLGESGVGKEIIARRLHRMSGCSGSFIGVNISSIPQELFESEFYGHEKGSFTNAIYQKKGLFELADGGTLFIDEVGDIPLSMQVKLLRILQEKQFMRVGGTKLINSDFRLIAATNRDLRKKIRDGSFREDLFYRLNIIPVNIPPLRDRKEDIIALSYFYIDYFSKQYNIEPPALSQEILDKILAYDWPGNVRQLKNFIERFCLVLQNKDILSFFSDEERITESSESENLFKKKLPLKELNDLYFEFMYKEKKGVVSGSNGIAAALGISCPTAHSWINRLGLHKKYQSELVKVNAPQAKQKGKIT